MGDGSCDRLYGEDDSDSSVLFPELERRGSMWDTDDSTTPMTTRPHFQLHPLSPHRTPQQSPPKKSRRDDSGGFLGWNLVLPSMLLDENHKGLQYTENTCVGCRTAATSIVDGEQSPLLLHNNASTDRQKSGHVDSCAVSVVYGAINAIIVLPILMSFGSIIYRDDAFAPYMPVLVKLTIVSGVVHQLCFSTISSLPFAVGQVQDAGLIFLSSMATTMVQYSHEQGHDAETMLATVTVGLSVATALLGVGLVLVGHLRLAQYVKHLPASVIGGYLAYIGWFCGVSGIGLMAGSSNVTPLVVVENFRYIFPGLLFGVVIYFVSRRLRHLAVLPVAFCQ